MPTNWALLLSPTYMSTRRTILQYVCMLLCRKQFFSLTWCSNVDALPMFKNQAWLPPCPSNARWRRPYLQLEGWIFSNNFRRKGHTGQQPSFLSAVITPVYHTPGQRYRSIRYLAIGSVCVASEPITLVLVTVIVAIPWFLALGARYFASKICILSLTTA